MKGGLVGYDFLWTSSLMSNWSLSCLVNVRVSDGWQTMESESTLKFWKSFSFKTRRKEFSGGEKQRTDMLNISAIYVGQTFQHKLWSWSQCIKGHESYLFHWRTSGQHSAGPDLTWTVRFYTNSLKQSFPSGLRFLDLNVRQEPGNMAQTFTCSSLNSTCLMNMASVSASVMRTVIPGCCLHFIAFTDTDRGFAHTQMYTQSRNKAKNKKTPQKKA